MARSFTGPRLIATATDVALIRDALYGRRDAAALDLIRRCDAALEAQHLATPKGAPAQ